MAKKEQKTNAMRLLDQAGIPYETLCYQCDGVNFDGGQVADQLGLPRQVVFKTLVAQDDRGSVVVCCVPVEGKLDLKALAAAAGRKRLELAALDRLLPLTGYVRGGCSPLGMKKQYPTFVDASCMEHGKIAVSAGIRGMQVYLSPSHLVGITGAATGDFCQDSAKE